MLVEVIVNLNWAHFVSFFSFEGILRWTLMIGQASVAVGFLRSSALMKNHSADDELVGTR